MVRFFPYFCIKYERQGVPEGTKGSNKSKLLNNLIKKTVMKKMMMLLAFCGLGTVAMAQTTEYPTLKHRVVTNSFWDNWFIDLGVTHLSSYSNTEHGLGLKKNPFWTGRRSWGGEASIGKWATPVLGVRLKGQLNWATAVAPGGLDGVDYTYGPNNPTYHSYSLSVQPLINLVNLFGGYKPRVYNLSIYGGVGYLHNTSTDYISILATAGLFNTFNITKRFHINIDAYVNLGEREMDSYGKDYRYLQDDRIKNRDWQVGFSAGVGVNLGKVGWDNAPDMDAILANHKSQIDALNNTIAGLEAENADLKNKLARKPKDGQTKVVKEFASTSACVFFNINKSVIASRKDLIDVKELAEYAKANDKTVVVTGYADSATGNATINQRLSEERAQAVADELVDMGVDKNKIETVAQGGVADLTPDSYNRRAVVTLK